jgi:hypothetical protein
LTHVWAFNAADQDVLERGIQSWNYLVGRLRDDGAVLESGESARTALAPDSSIDVIYDPPNTGRSDIFEAALEAWDLNDVRARTLEAFQTDLAVA